MPVTLQPATSLLHSDPSPGRNKDAVIGNFPSLVLPVPVVGLEKQCMEHRSASVHGEWSHCTTQNGAVYATKIWLICFVWHFFTLFKGGSRGLWTQWQEENTTEKHHSLSGRAKETLQFKRMLPVFPGLLLVCQDGIRSQVLMLILPPLQVTVLWEISQNLYKVKHSPF